VNLILYSSSQSCPTDKRFPVARSLNTCVVLPFVDALGMSIVIVLLEDLMEPFGNYTFIAFFCCCRGIFGEVTSLKIVRGTSRINNTR